MYSKINFKDFIFGDTVVIVVVEVVLVVEFVPFHLMCRLLLYQ